MFAEASRSVGGDEIGGVVCGQIGQLYAVEKKLREQKAGPALRQAMRAWQSQPVLNRLHRAMELTRRKTLPQGLLGQAIDYTLKRWTALNQFITDGILEIDNNQIENSIRPSALGKRNWMFMAIPKRANAVRSFTRCWAVVGDTASTRLII